MSGDTDTVKPTTHQADLAKLPRALAPLLERPQWVIWRWTPKPGGGWQKPPFMATQPARHASVTDSNTWTDYGTALAAVQAGHGDGVTYILTKQEKFAAIDLDHCRDVVTGSVEIWAQLMLEQALNSYAEITPSGNGLRIWGLASGDSLHRKFDLDTGDDHAVELFRATNKALTISGLDLRQGRSLGNIDRLMDWCAFFGEKHKPAPKAAAAPIRLNGNGSGYSVDEIDQIVRDGAPAGGDRSALFHTIVGHYTGCGWSIEQTFEHLHQFPNGIGERYIAEDRLAFEISRSFRKWNSLPSLSPDQLKEWTAQWLNPGGFEAKAPPQPPLQSDPELEDDVPAQKPLQEDDDELDDDDLADDELDDDEPAERQQTAFGSSHSWDEPDLSILDDRRGELPDFPVDVFTPAWQEWLQRAAHGAGVRPEHVAVPLLGIASSLIGTARRVRASSSWSEPMTLWACVVADSGDRKTPGLKVAVRALDRIERNNSADTSTKRLAHETRVQKAKEVQKKWKDDRQAALNATPPREPPIMPVDAVDPGNFIEPRLYVGDPTIEKLAPLLQARPRGMMLIRDELTGLFANMGRYSGGSDRPFWLEAWNGGRHVVERVEKSIVVEHLLVGVIGSFQPDKLARAFAGDEDGMYGRFLYTWPLAPGYRPLTNEAAEVEPELENALTALIRLPSEDQGGVFATQSVWLSTEAIAEFEEFRKFVDKTKSQLDGRERHWFVKGETAVLRLAGTLAYMAWAIALGKFSANGLGGITGALEPETIDKKFMTDAVRLWRDFFWPHASAAMRLIGLSEHNAKARRVLRWLQALDRIEVSREDVRRTALGRTLDADATEKLLATLVRAGWLRPVTLATGGRPTRRWEVNPKLLADPTGGKGGKGGKVS